MSNIAHEVVISGIGGKFPRSSTITEFKDKLYSKTSFIEKDTHRWNPAETEVPFYSSKVLDTTKFDASFFGIHPKLANNCDPMMGLLLEASFEAVLDAGVGGILTSEKNISVISTISYSDSEMLRITDSVYLDGLGMVGHARSMLANRISYCFNFKGPSYNLDSCWTSSLEGLQRAVSLVGCGEVEAALVVSSNVMFYDSLDEEYKYLGLIANDGMCLPFDDEGTGLVRGEGIVAIFIQRAKDAKRNYGTIVNIQSQCLGNRAGKYLGVDPKLSKFFKEFYEKCGVDPSEVAYIETGIICHKEFDIEELNALSEVFCPNDDSQLLIGSIKGNAGHADSTSGLLSLVKTIFAMETDLIPPTINYKTPNRRVPALCSGQLKPVTETTPLKGDFVGLTSVGYSGSVCHLLLKRNNKHGTVENSLPKLLAIQARNEEGACSVIEKLSTMPVTVESAALINDAFRSPFPACLWRAYTIVPTPEPKSDQCAQAFNPVKRPLWYVFSGMGSQWVRMGRDLLRLPVFAASIDKCDRVLAPLKINIKEIVTTENPAVFDNVINCFVGLAAIQIGLVDILNLISVKADGFVGHSVGEIACGYADGCFTAEEAVLAAYYRGLASIESEDVCGMMAAVGLSQADVRAQLPLSLDIACHNSSTSCTLSGPTDDVNEFVKQLQSKGVFAKSVSAAGIAYHSRYIKPIGAKLIQYMSKLITDPKPRSAKWICSSAPPSRWNTPAVQLASAEYFTNNLLSPVLFEEACKYIPEDAIVVEIGAHGLLQAILRRSMSPTNTNIPLTNRTAKCNLTHLLNAIGKLFLNSVDMEVNALYPKVQFPVSRGTHSLNELITWDHREEYYKELQSQIETVLNRYCCEKTEDINGNLEGKHLWNDHCIDDNVVIPISQLIMYPCNMIMRSKRMQLTEACIVVEDCVISDYIYVSDGKSLLVSYTLFSFEFEVSLTTDLHDTTNIVTGRFSEISPPSLFNLPPCDQVLEDVNKEQVYSVFAQFGFYLGPQLQTIERIRIVETGCFAELKWTSDIVVFLNSLLNIVVFMETDQKHQLLMPVRFKKLMFSIESMRSYPIGEVVEVFYDKRCHRVVSGAVEICGLMLKPVTNRKLPSLVWQEIKFQPYFSTVHSVKELCSVTAQLARQVGLKMWHDKFGLVKMVILKPGKNTPSDFILALTDTVKSQLHEYFKCVEVELEKAKELVVSRDVFVLAGDFCLLESLLSSAPQLVNLFCISTADGNSTKDFKPIIVSKEVGNLAVYKKLKNSETRNVFKMESSNPKELQDLQQFVAAHQDAIVVTRKFTPRHLLPILAAEPYAYCIRTVFITDEDAPQFSSASSFYDDHLSCGLAVNILSGRKWGTLLNTVFQCKPDKTCRLDNIRKSSEENVRVECFGLNTTYLSRNQNWKNCEPELRYLDYSGSSGKDRVMGVAIYDAVTNSLTVDKSLRWPVPADWTLEDAATVPVIYALVYYSLTTRASISATDMILVNCGMSCVGQAAIKVALSFGASVVASVESPDEVNALKTLFPTIKLIFEAKFEEGYLQILKLTSGKGVTVVFNCLSGKHIELCKEVVSWYAQILHLGDIKIEDNEYIGMKQFVKGCSFMSINVNSIANCSISEKMVLKKSVQKGIEQGVVKPLHRTAFPVNQQLEAIQHLKTEDIRVKTLLNMREPKSSKNFSNDKIAVVAGAKPELWLDTVGWLMEQGVCRVVVFAQDLQLSDIHSRRLDKLTSWHQASVHLNSLKMIESYKDTVNVFNKIKTNESVSYIFCVGLDEDGSAVRNLDAVSRESLPQLEQFVSLLGQGAIVSESRELAGLPVHWVQSESLTSPAQLLPFIPSLLKNNDSNCGFFVVRQKEYSFLNTDDSQMQGFLPSSVEELCRVSKCIRKTVQFIQEITLSPGISELRENLLPVFVIPGLGAHNVRPLLRNFMHPTFCSPLPEQIYSVEEYAKRLFDAILQVQEVGPFNIVGETLGAIPAVAVSCLLEAAGHKVQLILLEPTTVDSLRVLCERHQSTLGPSILADTLAFQSHVVKEINKRAEWQEQLAAALEAARIRDTERDHVAAALNYLHNQMLALQTYSSSRQFRAKAIIISCLSHSPNDTYTKLFQESPNIVQTGDDSLASMFVATNTARIINENILYDWTLKHDVHWQ